MRDIIFDAVVNVNNRLVLDGLPSQLERHIPLVEIHYTAGEYAVYFVGQCLWDSDNDPRDDKELSVESFEKFIIKRIDEIRRVINHVTSGLAVF